jgi:hypothetical protein
MIVDLHVHTKLSADSNVTPEQYLEFAARSGRGLGAICFTEHRLFPTDPEIDRLYAELSDRFHISVFKGIEAHTDLGHLLLFGINHEVMRRFDLTSRMLNKNGGEEVSAIKTRSACEDTVKSAGCFCRGQKNRRIGRVLFGIPLNEIQVNAIHAVRSKIAGRNGHRVNQDVGSLCRAKIAKLNSKFSALSKWRVIDTFNVYRFDAGKFSIFSKLKLLLSGASGAGRRFYGLLFSVNRPSVTLRCLSIMVACALIICV